jgi:hypothetical protein
MNLLSRLLIAFAICLIAIPGVASLAPVQASDGTLWLSEDSGYVGDEIYVTGTNLTDYAGDWIYIRYETYDGHYETVDRERVESDGSFISDYFKIPESCKGDHYIGIDNNESGTPFLKDTFTVSPKVEIIDPEDAEGYVGDEITVKGTGFAEDEADIEIWYYRDSTHHVDFTVAGGADEYGSWEETFTVPDSVKGSHKIDADGRKSDHTIVGDDSLTVQPKISLLDEEGNEIDEGRVGQQVTVSGTGFRSSEENIRITYDGDEVDQIIEADTDTYGSWEATFEVPPCVKGSYEVDARGRYTTYAEVANVTFTVGPGISLNPASGHVGTTIAINGTGFAANELVTIAYDGVTKTTARTTSEGSFADVSFEATHTQSAHTTNHTVVATDGSGNIASAKFMMESNAPAKPTLDSPANGSRIGFIGSQAPSFQWTAVTDPSGVSYKLQIATDAGFANLVVPDISGLTATNYTLPEGQALTYGTYYWRVKAVDGAQNDSGWTAASSFKSGLLPLWAFIVIVVIVVALIAALVYLFILRRR